jgi:homocysteine S-methyltransferase
MELQNRTGPDWLHAKLTAGELIVIDGAMGTELEARGVPMHGKAWSGGAALSHPEVVRAIHKDYIAAGAEVIIANTFSSGRQVLEPAGLADAVADINRRAVQLARQARDEAASGPVAVAGSICEWAAPEGAWADLGRLSDAYREQADLLAEAGVDLIALEMCSHPTRSRLAAQAALATGLPVWLGLSCKRDGKAGFLAAFDHPQTPFDRLVDELAGCGAGVMNVMHSAIKDTPDGVAAVKRKWTGPIGVYPESGHFVMPHWQFVDIIAPDDLMLEARNWIASGVQIIGGCCGLGVPHIRALKAAFA